MQHPTNILEAPIATELLRFFDQNPVLSFVGFDLLTFDGITDEAASVIAQSGLDPLYHQKSPPPLPGIRDRSFL